MNLETNIMQTQGRRLARRSAVWLLVALCLAAGLWSFAWTRLRTDAVTPQADTAFLSSRYITGIAIGADGTIWVSTYGGLLRRATDGNWQRSTRRDGLPSNEVRKVILAQGQVIAITPLGAATWDHGNWHTETTPATNESAPAQAPGRICDANWQGREYAATAVGLQVRVGQTWRDVALPPSPGTHISALLPHDDALWAALYGDGIWAYDGHGWHRVDMVLPAEASEITALAEGQGALWIGTRRAALWEYCDHHWQHIVQSDEPPNHNCQAIAVYGEKLYVSTLEDGLAVRSQQGWEQVGTPTISSNAPRQMTMFGGQLYVWHGNGKVDCLVGTEWQLDVCHSLPRKQVSALAADEARLYAAQWGGWSEFDGKTWTHRLQLPELQGVPVTALYPEADRLWIGTQGRGLAEYDRSTGKLRWHDERNGLPDDWVTAISRLGTDLYVGTFVGGLARLDGGHWLALSELAGENVTALANAGTDQMFVTTRHGTWTLPNHGTITSLTSKTMPLDPEAQALCVVPGGVWVGTRTGLFYVRNGGTK
jgi:ligand-binding sensor domain-containing protein